MFHLYSTVSGNPLIWFNTGRRTEKEGRGFEGGGIYPKKCYNSPTTGALSIVTYHRNVNS